MIESFFLGYPVEFENICLIYPPKVKDVVGNKRFNMLAKALTLSQEEIEDEFTREDLDLTNLPTPFEYLLGNAFNNLQFRQAVEDAFLLFTKEKIIFLFDKKEIAIGDLATLKSIDKLRILREENFFDFQNMVRQSLGWDPVEPPRPDEDPRVKRIKAKARYRDYIKAKNGKQLKLVSSLASISCMGMGLNPLNIGELSYAAIPTLIGTYQLKEKYKIDVDSLLAGAADSKKVHPVYWIKNLDN